MKKKLEDKQLLTCFIAFYYSPHEKKIRILSASKTCFENIKKQKGILIILFFFTTLFVFSAFLCFIFYSLMSFIICQFHRRNKKMIIVILFNFKHTRSFV